MLRLLPGILPVFHLPTFVADTVHQLSLSDSSQTIFVKTLYTSCCSRTAYRPLQVLYTSFCSPTTVNIQNVVHQHTTGLLCSITIYQHTSCWSPKPGPSFLRYCEPGCVRQTLHRLFFGTVFQLLFAKTRTVFPRVLCTNSCSPNPGPFFSVTVCQLLFAKVHTSSLSYRLFFAKTRFFFSLYASCCPPKAEKILSVIFLGRVPCAS